MDRRSLTRAVAAYGSPPSRSAGTRARHKDREWRCSAELPLRFMARIAREKVPLPHLPIAWLASRFPDMSTVADIKAAISRLSLEERAEVARCLHEWGDDAWDGQMQHDLAAGKLDGLLAKVDADIDAGKLRDLP